MKKTRTIFLLIIMAICLLPLQLLALDLVGIGDYEQQLEQITIKNGPPLQTVDQNLKSFSHLIELFNSFKTMDISFGESLLKKVQVGDPLTGDEIYYLRRTITTYYKINQKMLDFAKIYKADLDDMPRDFSKGAEKLPAIKAHLIYLSGHILVLEHLIQMHKIYYATDPNFRRIVKKALLDKEIASEGPSKNLNDLIKMSQYTVTVGDDPEFAKQIILVREIANDLKKILVEHPHSLILLNVILTNDIATQIAQGKNNFRASYYFFIDIFIDYFEQFTAWLSEIFGNWAGSVSSRSGHLKNNLSALSYIQKELKPMDVIFDRSPFVLTDKFIPGYFDHAALYLGTEAQLKALGMWDHPSLVPYQNEIRNGHTILEAVRTGVHLNSVAGFMNIDTFMMMRKENGLASPDILIDQITRGMDQMGKPYDFNFDVETLDKIVCSELIYIIFGNVHWPTKYRFGRTTITPDDVAEILFQKGSQFHQKLYIDSNSDTFFRIFNIDNLASTMGYTTKMGETGYFKATNKCYKVNSPFLNRKCETVYTQTEYQEKE